MACLKGLDFKVIQQSLAKRTIFGYCLLLYLDFWRTGSGQSLESDAGTNGTQYFKFQCSLVYFFWVSDESYHSEKWRTGKSYSFIWCGKSSRRQIFWNDYSGKSSGFIMYDGIFGLDIAFKYDAILSFYKNSGININPIRYTDPFDSGSGHHLFFVFKKTFWSSFLGKLLISLTGFFRD
jgi:hypothetical protein